MQYFKRKAVNFIFLNLLLMKYPLVIIFSFIFISASAQNGFYLQPEFGAGMANAKVKIQDLSWPFMLYPPGPAKSITNYTGRLGIGYQWKNWSISSGIDFIKTGYSWQYLTGDFITYYNTEVKYDYHFIVPVMAAYKFNIGKRFLISPSAGGAVSWNYAERQTIYASPYKGQKGNETQNKLIKGSEFYNSDVPVSFWVAAKAMAGYKINSRLSIIAGPEAMFMLGSMVKNSSLSQKNYTYTFNTGVTWQLGKSMNSTDQNASKK
jgi:hypothetical protein